jgi:prepilin-type N-terminal cleavage/methylation domain-containing protein
MSCNVVNSPANTRSHRSARETRGFTLVEMMIIVVIVGVLATLATYGVTKYIRTSRTSEAIAMVVDIKGAEEIARDETFQYIGLSGAYNAWHPIDPPGNFKTDWTRQSGPMQAIFQQLAVVSSGPVYFTYSIVAGLANQNITPPPVALDMHFPLTAQAPFYIVVAKGDLDGDLINSYVVGHSFGSDLYVEQEGE